MPWALLAITVAQMGFQMQQQEQAKAAASASQTRSTKEAIQNQSRLTEQSFNERRGTLIGGNNTPASADISRQGTILGQSNQQNRSLLGG